MTLRPSTAQARAALALAFLAMAPVGATPPAAAFETGLPWLLGIATLPVAGGLGALARERPEAAGAIRPLAFEMAPGPLLAGAAATGAMPTAAASRPGLPRVFAPTQPRQRHTRYPWKRDIVSTVFWIGERPTRNNPTPNHMSSWDMRWVRNYGGYDNPAPSAREGYAPAAFTPMQNPFYIALPYNDITRSGTKPSAKAMVPWFQETFYRSGRTVLKGRWVAIRRGDSVCYAQWEDVGPFETDDPEYVFGDASPKTKGNRGAGLDVSPAVRDYLKFDGGYGTVDWRFVDLDEVPDGPWTQWGANNPFASELAGAGGLPSKDFVLVPELRGRLLLAASEEAPSTGDLPLE